MYNVIIYIYIYIYVYIYIYIYLLIAGVELLDCGYRVVASLLLLLSVSQKFLV